jgi:phosphatidylserine decarboxylase
MQPIITIALILITILFILLLLWRFYFLRNPTPNIPTDPNAIIAPAEGKIARIVHFTNKKPQNIEKGLFGRIKLITEDVAKSGYLILIRLHVYNVHYQRAPIAGTIERVTYHQGAFLNAVKKPQNLRCLFQNERNETIIKGKIKCKVIQIAGYLARRIECFVEQNEKVQTGQEIGLINLGSQVAIILPECDITIKEGENIKVGETIIGQIPHTRGD